MASRKKKTSRLNMQRKQEVLLQNKLFLVCGYNYFCDLSPLTEWKKRKKDTDL